MKAIDTLYKGCYFRSRTEARWAVFFDALGVRWEYEKEGYDLGDGIYYLPDFWFPDHKMFGEVKPEGELTKDEVEKAKRLCRQSGRTVWIFKGIPSFGFEKDDLAVPCYFFGKPHFASDENGFDPKPGEWNDAMYEIERVNYFNYYFPFTNDLIPIPDGMFESGQPCEYCHDKFLIATRKARSARFEHGE
jgi:hypothetical protein